MKRRLSKKKAAERLAQAGLEATAHRLRVLMAAANTDSPRSAPEILDAVGGSEEINRVTVYRILDLFVEHQILNRLDLGEKSQRFCLRDQEHATEHAHLHCMHCDRYLCLKTSLPVDQTALEKLDLEIKHVDIRLEGVCPACNSIPRPK